MLLGLLGGYGWALAQVEPEAVWPRAPVAAVVSPAALPLQAPQPLLLRLKPRDRARVLAALAGLVILGFTLIALAWWGARFTRRYLKRPWPGGGRQRFSNVSEYDWAGKPLYVTDSEDNGDADTEHGRDE